MLHRIMGDPRHVSSWKEMGMGGNSLSTTKCDDTRSFDKEDNGSFARQEPRNPERAIMLAGVGCRTLQALTKVLRQKG
jgi:hypothetical protein